MAGRRPLTPTEERSLIRLARRLPPRDRLLITLQLFSGFRIREVLSLTLGQVWRNHEVPPVLGVRPGFLKGHHGTTRYVPIAPEMRRAIEDYIKIRLPDGMKGLDGTQQKTIERQPLFLSRQVARDSGEFGGLCTAQGARIIKRAFARARIYDDGRLGTHTLRKSFARRVYQLSGHDLLLTRDALGHSSVAITELYLETNREALERMLRRSDWTRAPQDERQDRTKMKGRWLSEKPGYISAVA